MSDESDIEDRVVSERDDDSDGQDSAEYDSEEEYESADSNAFVDMEAVESDGDESEYDLSLDHTEQHFFPQFARLPKELRAAIWEFFDPYLKLKLRLYETEFITESNSVQAGVRLMQQTARARAMLSTHRESRELALKFYPDTIVLHEHTGMESNRHRTFRLRYETDIIFLTASSPLEDFSATLDILLQTSLRGVKNLAFGPWRMFPPNGSPQYVHQLKTIYSSSDAITKLIFYDKPAASNLLCSFSTKLIERDEIGVPRVYEMAYYWPDLAKDQELAEKGMKPIFDRETFKVWPIAQYYCEDGVPIIGKTWLGSGSDSESGSESVSGDEDEYESSGIDDATINSEDVPSDDGDDLVLQSDSEEEEEEDVIHAFDGFSPVQDERSELRIGDEAGVGNFSSLEPESPNRDGNHSEHAVSDEEPVRTTGRAKRRIVLSDDEDEPEIEGDRAVKMPSRPAKRAKRSRVVLSDTEDDSEDEGEAMEHGRDAGDRSEDGSSSEEEEADASEEEPADKKPMSLFEKLGRFREENPVPSDSDAGSDDDASMSGEDFYGSRGNDFQDDEAGDEDDPLGDGGEADMLDDQSEDEEEDEW
ncbi:hypothetical protein GGS26DRAFT_591170 [Hypomontagnella submonticulosa]|nr:hypothetical protein GGS26DRAFT_591170 [Hypomontagnella submonticulosa]